MISRSDGETFHLLLADGPVAYPAEIKIGSTNRVFVGFWYAHAENDHATFTRVVI